MGNDCPGNGENPEIECCCNECDYMLCCIETWTPEDCIRCNEKDCPRKEH